MTAERLRAEIRALKRLPGGAWPKAMALLEEVAEMLEELEDVSVEEGPGEGDTQIARGER